MYSLVSTTVKSISTKLLVSFCRKTSIWLTIDSFSSSTDLSFLIRANTYFARAAGSASHLRRSKWKYFLNRGGEGGRWKNCDFLQRLQVGGEPTFKLLLLLDKHCVELSWCLNRKRPLQAALKCTNAWNSRHPETYWGTGVVTVGSWFWFWLGCECTFPMYSFNSLLDLFLLKM